MTAPSLRMVCLIDEDVPLSVADFMQQRGHTVYTVKQSTFEGEPDEIIARLGDQISRETQRSVVLITWNHSSFR
jgi:hypothetical protein